MSEIGLVEIFSMAEAIALIGTLFVILYFSRKQAQSLSVDIETKVLNDLAERMHAQVEILIGRPQLTKVLSKVEEADARTRICLRYFIYVCTCISYAPEKSIERQRVDGLGSMVQKCVQARRINGNMAKNY